MKQFLAIILCTFALNFVRGYLHLKQKPNEEAKSFCQWLMREPLWLTATLANGEANACFDIGILPTKAEASQ